MKLTWSSQYEIGIGVIDAQHQRIVEYINDVHDIKANNHDPVELQRVLHYLVDYTVSHFAFEEALMEEAGYKQIDAHKNTHGYFIKRLKLLQQSFDKGEDVAEDLADMLQDWLIQHIQSDDVSYSEDVKNNISNKSSKDHKSWVAKAMNMFFK